MTTAAPLPCAQEVAAFWRDAGPSRWFAKNEAFDAEFKSRFEAAHHAAATGTLDGWASEAEGALALLVLLDQFPRNAWRGSAHMFATDGAPGRSTCRSDPYSCAYTQVNSAPSRKICAE